MEAVIEAVVRLLALRGRIRRRSVDSRALGGQLGGESGRGAHRGSAHASSIARLGAGQGIAALVLDGKPPLRSKRSAQQRRPHRGALPRSRHLDRPLAAAGECVRAGALSAWLWRWRLNQYCLRRIVPCRHSSRLGSAVGTFTHGFYPPMLAQSHVFVAVLQHRRVKRHPWTLQPVLFPQIRRI